MYPIAAFIGSQFVNAAGEWLGDPQAVFYGVNAQVLGSRPPFTPLDTNVIIMSSGFDTHSCIDRGSPGIIAKHSWAGPQ